MRKHPRLRTFKNVRCFECDGPGDHEHHVIPRSLGGTRTVWLCELHHGLVHEREFLSHRELTRKGMERLRKLGKYTGGVAPYGFFIYAGELRPHEQEQRVIARARDLHAKSLSLRAISDMLTEEGHLSRTGTPFTPSAVNRMIKS